MDPRAGRRSVRLSRIAWPGIRWTAAVLGFLLLLSEIASRRDSGVGEEDGGCRGGRIHVYNISTVFNQDLVAGCAKLRRKTDPLNMDLCPLMENGGMGRSFQFQAEQGGPLFSGCSDGSDGAWFHSWQFSLEQYFHQRLLQHPCVTTVEEEGDLFFVPFFTGMDLIRRISHHMPRNQLHLELLEWLRKRQAWQRNKGLDHFLVLGRIASDFRRSEGSPWGNQMMLHSDWQKMVKVTIERSPSKTAEWDKEIAVPYPTYFYPSSDCQLQAVVRWMLQSSQRSTLATFAGQGRPQRLGDSLRKQVMQQCESDARCSSVLCSEKEGSGKKVQQVVAGGTLHASCHHPSLLLTVFHRSIFCLQPPGDSPTRRSLFDAMLAGCIPVIFTKNSAWTQYTAHLPQDGHSYSVFIPMESVRRKESILDHLASIPSSRIQSMRAVIGNILPRLIYSHHHPPQTLPFKDAFDVALEAVMNRIFHHNRPDESV